jgi:hypothetical protein
VADDQTSPAKRAIIHVGLPKCASSAVQEALQQGRASLLAAGWFYPALPNRKDPTRGARGHMLLAGEMKAAMREEKPCAMLQSVREDANAAGAAGLVLSSEGFFNITPTPVTLGAALDGYAVETVVLTRPFDSWVVARYKQKIKGRRGQSESFTDWIEQQKYMKVVPYIAPAVRRNGEAFGARRITVRSIVGEDAIQIMSDIVGVTLPRPKGVINPSLTDVAAAYMARSNKAGDDEKRKQLRKVLVATNLSDIAPDFRLLTPAQAEWLHERAVIEHEALRAEFDFDGAPPKPPVTRGTRNVLTAAELKEIDRRVGATTPKDARKKRKANRGEARQAA